MNNKWLLNFKTYWLNKDIDSVMNLFLDDLVYFETPYQKITDKTILKKEWECVLDHNINTLEFEEYTELENRLAIKFKYEYELNGKEKKFTGIYLIELEEGKCKYFYQVGE